LGIPLLGASECSPNARKTVLITVRVVKKGAKIFTVFVDLNDLYVEIKAIVNGKEEFIQTSITREEAEALQNGGQLVIKGEDGKEFPVSYTSK